MTLEEAVQKLSPNALYLWLWLQYESQPCTADTGEVKMSLAEIARRTKMTIQEVRTAMRSCVSNTIVNTLNGKRGNTCNTLLVSRLYMGRVNGVTHGLVNQTSTKRKESAPETPI